MAVDDASSHAAPAACALRLQLDIPGEITGETTADPSYAAAAEALAAVPVLTGKELGAFRKAIKLDPHDPDYQFILGRAFGDVGRHEEAARALHEAVRLRPEDGSYHQALGEALARLGRHGEAFASFEQARRLQPDEVRLLNGIGAVLTELGRSAEAVPIFEQALRLDADQADLRNNLGVALWRAGRTAEAVRAWHRAIQLRPTTVYVRRNLAAAFAAIGHHKAALDCLRQIVRLRPDDAGARIDLADALYALGRHAEANVAYEKAVDIDPSSVAARATSLEARQAILLDRIRKEGKGPASPFAQAMRLLWNAVFAVEHALKTLVTGAGRVGAGFGILLLASLGFALWQTAPPYFTHHLLRDEMVSIARAPLTEDSDVLDRLMHAVREHGLEPSLQEGSFRIQTREKWRTITCEYDVPVQILPGVRHTLHFRIRVEEPYLGQREKNIIL